MSIEVLYPFQLTSSGSVATTQDPSVQANQHVTSLVSTSPGERVMMPGYGVSLAALVFAPNDTAVLTVIQQDVTKAINAYEPSIVVNSISPARGNDPTQGQAMVNVDFSIGAQAGQPGSVQTATVLVGGSVIADS